LTRKVEIGILTSANFDGTTKPSLSLSD
jgi:hypothetical protein